MTHRGTTLSPAPESACSRTRGSRGWTGQASSRTQSQLGLTWSFGEPLRRHGLWDVTVPPWSCVFSTQCSDSASSCVESSENRQVCREPSRTLVTSHWHFFFVARDCEAGSLFLVSFPICSMAGGVPVISLRGDPVRECDCCWGTVQATHIILNLLVATVKKKKWVKLI